MAILEHLEILNEGVARWNNWRRREPQVLPDLSDAKLKALHGLEDPYDLILEGVDFRKANLRGVFISDALLCGSQLQQSDLFDARIKNSNLRDCNLAEAAFISTTIMNCDLSSVDFSGATFGNTIIIATDLSQSKNIVTANHKFPSSISIDTLEKTVIGLRRRPTAIDGVLYFLEAAGIHQDYLKVVKQRIGPSAGHIRLVREPKLPE